MNEKSDWQFGKSLPERMKYMLDNQLMCDVTFRVGPDKNPIQAHKYMLSSASPVFYSMFEGPMAEKGEVDIPDIDLVAFKGILRYIYTDGIEVNPTNIKGMLYGSEKYMLHNLKDKCSEFLSSSIDVEHACIVFQAAQDFHMEDLKEKAFEFILKHGKSCFESNYFRELSEECLRKIIESDDFQCKEEFVYEKMVEWAEAKCGEQKTTTTDKNIRECLGDLLYLIRFPLMDSNYFTKEISNNAILTPSEILKIFQYYHGQQLDLFPKKSRLSNAVEFRRCILNKDSTWNQKGDEDCIDFKTSFDSLFSGISVFGSASGSGKYDIILNLLNGTNTLGSITTTLSCAESQQIYEIHLSDIVYLSKDKLYTVQLKMTGPPAFLGKDYKSFVVNKNLNLTFYSSSLPSPNGTRVTGGQIPGIILHPC